jgi:hypothetical protein
MASIGKQRATYRTSTLEIRGIFRAAKQTILRPRRRADQLFNLPADLAELAKQRHLRPGMARLAPMRTPKPRSTGDRRIYHYIWIIYSHFGHLTSPLIDRLSSAQFASLKHLPQITVAEANPRWPQQASEPQLGAWAGIRRVLNVQKRVTHEIAVPGNKAGRQRFLLNQIARVPKLISAGVGKWVVQAVAIRLANAGRQPRL